MTDTLPLSQPVLVTGGAGFIGRHLVEALIQRGDQVRAFDLPGVAMPPAWQGRVTMISGDVTRPEDVRGAMQGAGTVFHTAAVVSDWAPREAHERVTLEGTRHVLGAAVQNNARVLLLSSFAVYGDKIGRQELREDSGFGRPLGLYCEYKRRQEELAWEYHRQQGLALSVVRPSKVYGPGSQPWVHEVARVLLRRQPALVDGGDYNPGLVYVDNLVDIIIRAASLPQAVGHVYNGYDGTTTTLRQYFSDIARIVGAPPPRSMPRWVAHLLAAVIEPTWKILRKRTRPLLTRDSLRFISSDYQISTERARQELGFQPRISYAEGIRRVEAYWKEIHS